MTQWVEAPSTGWPDCAVASTPRDLKKRKSLFGHFASWMARNVPHLWSGQPDPGYTPEFLETQLSNLLATESELAAHRILANWWDMLLGEGHRLKRWNVRPGSQRVKLPPERPSFVRRDFQLLTRLRPIEAAFLDRLGSSLDSRQRYHAFMLSAVLNGGILSTERLSALLGLSADAVQMIDGVLWATLNLPVSGSPNGRPLRWYPDALTATLLTKVLENGPLLHPEGNVRAGRAVLWSRLEATLNTLELPPWRGELNELLRAVRVSTALSAPGFVAAYLAEDLESHSLPDPVFQRVLGARLPAADSPSAEPKHAPPLAPAAIELDVDFDPDLPRNSQMSITRQVCKTLDNKRGAIDRLKKILEEHHGRLWPITHALIGWTMWRLDPGCPLGKIKASSAQTYFRTLAVHLIYEAEDLDLLDLDVDDFETLYELAARRVGTESRRAYFWGRLRDFHDYLFLGGAPDIDLRELDGWVAKGSVRVSANLVTEREFQRFKKALEMNRNHPAAEMVFLAGMLGYRAGLRRREAQMLRIHDVHPGPDPFLLIRPSKLASLKSNAAKRRIPLRALLPVDELTILMDFHERRKAQADGKDGLLFASPDAPWTPTPYSTLIDPITALFAAITGQVGVPFRFHHLRHSFANWVLVAMLATDEPELLTRKLPLLDAHLLSNASQVLLRTRFYPTLEGSAHYPERRHLYQVAALMGHLSPSTTCQSYLHLLDWLSGRYLDLALDHRLRHLGGPDLGRICGLSSSMPYKREYRDFAHSAVAFLRHHVAMRAKAQAPIIEHAPAARTLPTLSDLIKPTLPTPSLLITLLRRHFSGTSIQKLESIFAIPASAITAATEAYLRMYAKQSVQHPKGTIPVPRPPRSMEQQCEYFRIVERAYASARNAENRLAMSALAEALIQRTGPKTGKIYFGTEGRDFKMILKGLILLGVDAAEMTLIVRRPAAIREDPDFVTNAVDHAKSEGIAIEGQPLEWEKREVKGVLLRLDVRATQPVVALKGQHLEGRIRGLNHAAAWIRFIDHLPSVRTICG